jgi:hypothetical protein
MATCKYKEIQFTDEDVVNPEDFIGDGEYNPHNVRPYLVHDHGFVVGVAFADCLQDALDVLADNGKLDGFKIDPSDYSDYEVDSDSPTCTFLGNDGAPFDIDPLDVIELPIPKAASFAETFALRFGN